jgi:hypothetical protein
MAGVFVAQGAILGIQDGVEKCDKFAGGQVAAKESIQLGADCGGRFVRGGEGTKGGLEIGHKERGGNSLPGDITDADAEPVRIELNDVEVVAADGSRGLPGAGEFDSRKLRQGLGHQILLDVAGAVEFLLLLLKSGGSFFDSLLQLFVLLLQPILNLTNKVGNRTYRNANYNANRGVLPEYRPERHSHGNHQEQQHSGGQSACQSSEERERKKNNPIPWE